MRNKYLLFAVFCIMIVLFVAKFRSNSIETTNKLQVVASIYPLYYFASVIGGNTVDLTMITPSGVEPHDYEPTAHDMATIEKADLVILNGVIESWQGSNVSTVVAGDGLITKNDPHIWLDPMLSKQEAHAIAIKLMSIDPLNASRYQENELKLDTLLSDLDREYRDGLADCRLKDIITSHAAFSYLTERYGLKQISIAGASPDAEPGAKQLISVTNFAREHQIKYIFVEKLVSPKLAQTIATETGAQTLVLDPLEGVSDDERKAGKNYLSIMRENLKNLQTALVCKP